MNLQAYLKADRQWPHHLRVAHAQAELKRATSDKNRAFWKSVLKANNKGMSFLRRAA